MANLGRPIVTAGGLASIAATTDPYLRAFDLRTGRSSGKRVYLRPAGHADDMPRCRWTPVCRDYRRWAWRAWDTVWQLYAGLCPAADMTRSVQTSASAGGDAAGVVPSRHAATSSMFG